MFKTLLLLPLFLAASVLAARPVTVQILVIRRCTAPPRGQSGWCRRRY